ncbi:recombinase family protein, partial [Aerococcus urinae]|nr:recombinase family protein [Aerococcus urinae]
LCKSISRLARNTVDLLATVRELKDLGVAVRFEREQIDTLSADGELLLTLLASFVQEESRSMSKNVKWGIRKKYADGSV